MAELPANTAATTAAGQENLVSIAPATASLNARVLPTAANPRGYPAFDPRLFSTYTNNQLRYYHKNAAMVDVDPADLQAKIVQRKAVLESLDWNGETRDNSDDDSSTRPPTTQTSESRTLSFALDGEPDSDCPEPMEGHRGTKFNPADLTKLRHNGDVAQYNNWIQDLRSAFDGDPARYPTNRHKIILAILTLDDQLKTTYNSIVRTHPAISFHWRKFKRWAKDTVLHGDSDLQKLSDEFTMARHRVTETPNEFYLRLLNLGIQSDREVSIQDFRTRLVSPLKNLMNQQDRTYPTLQDAVTHAGKLWITLNPEKVRQEIKDDRARRQREQNQSDRAQPGQRDRQQSSRQPERDQQRRSWTSNRDPQRSQSGRQSGLRRLSDAEHQYRVEKNLCLNCGYPGHQIRDCSYPFNPRRAPPRRENDNTAKSQPLRGQRRPRPEARSQPTRVSDDDIESVSRDSGSDQDSDQSSKRRKN